MDIINSIFGVLVAIIGLFGWTACLPQIRLLIKVKDSKSISPSSLLLTAGMQMILLIHILLQKHLDVRLFLVYVTSLSSCLFILSLIYYYRKYPGGRKENNEK